MKVGDILYGFEIKAQRRVEDIDAVLWEMEHLKSGAALVFTERADENKTFSIAFKTIPEDSTGVFHIIEHSVLCGSEKYPVKEPFVELLKGSLQTFLNAMTFPDKTVYPVSSRNEKDFYNLVSVYLDAVLHPLILKKKEIFLQEGWHYEINGDGELTRSGVVLNEMKGAFSSADDMSLYYLQGMLYPDVTYRFESGGEPSAICDLTYEDFVNAHRKYYHPSNAKIFLDGEIDLNKTLCLIDSYLSEYEREDRVFTVPDQQPVPASEMTVEYEIAENEDEKDKTRIAIGYMAARYDEKLLNVAFSIVNDAICSSNESPLKKALIESGLCEDVSVSSVDSMKQNMVIADFRNVKDGCERELIDLFEREVNKLCIEGIDKELLTASLNACEFRMREKDFGTMPKGVIYAITSLETWLYGGDPVSNLELSETFKEIRKGIEEGLMEKVLTRVLGANERKATLIMHPSSTLGKQRAEEERRLLGQIKASMSEQEIEKIKKDAEELVRIQGEPDREEDIAKLPALTIDDIPKKVKAMPCTVEKVGGVSNLVYKDINTDGIVYAELYFDMSDLDEVGVADARLLCDLLMEVDTENHSALALQSFVKSRLGSLDVRPLPLSNGKNAKFYLHVSASALPENADLIPELVSEVLLKSDFDDKETVKSIVKQMKMSSEDAFTSAGHQIGLTRAFASSSCEGALREYLSGYEAYLSLKALDNSFDTVYADTVARIKRLVHTVAVKERLTLSVVGDATSTLAYRIIDSFPSGSPAGECPILPLPSLKEGIAIPSRVSYAERCLNVSDSSPVGQGVIAVVRSLVSYNYLWNEVRVKGGAYGCGLVNRPGLNVGFYSYRDPSPKRTIDIYSGCADFLTEFASSDADITKSIIGAMGEADPLMTQRLKVSVYNVKHLRGITREMDERTRAEMLSVGKDQLLLAAKTLDRVASEGAVCVVGPIEALKLCDLDRILEI